MSPMVSVVEGEGAHYPWESAETRVGSGLLPCPALGKLEGNVHASGFRLVQSRETEHSLYNLVLAWLRAPMQPGTEEGNVCGMFPIPAGCCCSDELWCSLPCTPAHPSA